MTADVEQVQPRSDGERRAYGDGYLAALNYAIELAGQPVKEGDARGRIIERLAYFRDGLKAIHDAQ